MNLSVEGCLIQTAPIIIWCWDLLCSKHVRGVTNITLLLHATLKVIDVLYYIWHVNKISPTTIALLEAHKPLNSIFDAETIFRLSLSHDPCKLQDTSLKSESQRKGMLDKVRGGFNTGFVFGTMHVYNHGCF